LAQLCDLLGGVGVSGARRFPFKAMALGSESQAARHLTSMSPSREWIEQYDTATFTLMREDYLYDFVFAFE
jgi:hypothetical protein